MSAMDFFHQIRLGSYQLALPVPRILELCTYLQNAVAKTYILVLQLSTFLFYNKQMGTEDVLKATLHSYDAMILSRGHVPT